MRLFGKKKNIAETERLPNATDNVNRMYPSPTTSSTNDRNVSPIWSNPKQESSYMLSQAERGTNTSPANDTLDVVSEYSLMEIDGRPIYIVKQARGYLSILFSLVQIGILITMMVQCGIAPMKMNPMIGPYPDALSYWGGKNSY